MKPIHIFKRLKTSILKEGIFQTPTRLSSPTIRLNNNNNNNNRDTDKIREREGGRGGEEKKKRRENNRANGERSRKISHAAVSRNEVAARGAGQAGDRCTACAPFLLDFSKPIERSRSREQHA